MMKTHKKLYQTWSNMMMRCYNKKSRYYRMYGGRGIEVCHRWHDFDKFCEDVGEKPDGLTLDRTDNNKGYSPDNFRWTDQKTQVRNSRSCKYITYKGETRLLKEWTEILGLDYQPVKQRLLHNWPLELALETPILRKGLKRGPKGRFQNKELAYPKHG